jgi:hypothetical protein
MARTPLRRWARAASDVRSCDISGRGEPAPRRRSTRWQGGSRARAAPLGPGRGTETAMPTAPQAWGTGSTGCPGRARLVHNSGRAVDQSSGRLLRASAALARASQAPASATGPDQAPVAQLPAACAAPCLPPAEYCRDSRSDLRSKERREAKLRADPSVTRSFLPARRG